MNIQTVTRFLAHDEDDERRLEKVRAFPALLLSDLTVNVHEYSRPPQPPVTTCMISTPPSQLHFLNCTSSFERPPRHLRPHSCPELGHWRTVPGQCDGKALLETRSSSSSTLSSARRPAKSNATKPLRRVANAIPRRQFVGRFACIRVPGGLSPRCDVICVTNP